MKERNIMKKWIKITAIVLIIVLSCGMLTGCGEQKKIKKACEEDAKEILDKTSSQMISKGMVAVGEIYEDKTAVSYDKDDNTFTCKVYAVVCYSTLFVDGQSFMYEKFSFRGHMDKSDVVIDYRNANEISKSDLP